MLCGVVMGVYTVDEGLVMAPPLSRKDKFVKGDRVIVCRRMQAVTQRAEAEAEAVGSVQEVAATAGEIGGSAMGDSVQGLLAESGRWALLSCNLPKADCILTAGVGKLLACWARADSVAQ